jgi:rubrerythrin
VRELRAAARRARQECGRHNSSAKWGKISLNSQEALEMKSLKGTKTHQNLKNAFAGESQANRRYLYFAKVADVEGQPEIAGLFRDTAEGETGHAHGHLDYLKTVGDPVTDQPIGDSLLNLKSAVHGETYEYTDMYPGMAKTAREEGFAEIADWFETLAKAEKSHAGRFAKAQQTLS